MNADIEHYCIFCFRAFSVLSKRQFIRSNIDITELHEIGLGICEFCIEHLFFATCLGESFSNSDDLTYTDCEPERYET